ncbi:hypothetical protein GCM10018791_27390 [Streptomyces zaomyceticus]|nr:hypothetical protein GCM10018791_27390 [Streptomyces zaomyceticus]
MTPLAGPVQQPDPRPGRPVAQSAQGAFGEARVPCVDTGGLADHRDLPVPEAGQMLHAERAGRGEVEIDAAQPGGVGGQPDQDGRRTGRAQYGQPFVVELDVHQDHRLGEPAAGDPPQRRRTFLPGQQQDVVAVGTGGGGDGDRDLQHHRHVHVGAQRDHQRDDPRTAAGEGPGARVRLVAELLDAGPHPAAGGVGDGPLAAEDIAHRARRHSGVPGDLGKRDHPFSPRPVSVTMRCDPSPRTAPSRFESLRR